MRDGVKPRPLAAYDRRRESPPRRFQVSTSEKAVRICFSKILQQFVESALLQIERPLQRAASRAASAFDKEKKMFGRSLVLLILAQAFPAPAQTDLLLL